MYHNTYRLLYRYVSTYLYVYIYIHTHIYKILYIYITHKWLVHQVIYTIPSMACLRYGSGTTKGRGEFFHGFFYWLMVVEFGSFQFIGIVV